jgi:hypothetical protein
LNSFISHPKKEDDCLGQMQPLSYWQNYGYQPSIVFLNVVHGGLLEPNPKMCNQIKGVVQNFI